MRDRVQSLYAHEHHLGTAKFNESIVVDRVFRFRYIFVTSKKRDVRVLFAMCYWNSGISCRGNRRGNSRDNLELNSGRCQRLGFFRAASEYKGITAFQPDNGFSLSGLFHQQRINFIL